MIKIYKPVKLFVCMFKKKRYKVSKYSRWKKRRLLETYDPEYRLDFKKEQALPFFVRVSYFFVFLGGVISLFFLSLFYGVKSFFGFKEQIKSTKDYKVVKYNKKRAEVYWS